MRCKSLMTLGSFGGVALVWCSSPVSAQTTLLGSAQSFAVLGGSMVTNTGSSTVAGDLGVWPGTVVTGFPPGLVTGGTIHTADAVAMQAQGDVTAAYVSLAGMPSTQDLTGQDLGGLTLTAGVYSFSTSAQLTGTLTLDAQGVPNSMFVFQIGSTLTTASNSTVSAINAADNCNVYWQVGSSATLGTGTSFQGNILALSSITLNTGAGILGGRALARNGAVTLDNVQVVAGCPCIPGSASQDCNSNGVLDACDIAAGTSVDCNNNGMPDECDLPGAFPHFTACEYAPWASAGVPMSFDICVASGSAGGPVTLSLRNALPPGATLTPPLPAVGNTVCTTFHWTPTSSQLGTPFLEFFATDANGCVAECKTRLAVIQAYLVFGPSFGSSQFSAFGNVFDTQLSSVRRIIPVSMDSLPSFPYFLLPSHYFAQVVAFSPSYPPQPYQWSYAVEFTKGLPGQTMSSANFGTKNRIDMGVRVFTDPNGQRRVSFPFVLQ